MSMQLLGPGKASLAGRHQRVAERWYSEKRLGGLSRFAFAITVLNVLGHAFLGFEQSWLTPFVAVGFAYATDLVGESVEARCTGRPPRYSGGTIELVKFLLPAHISGLAVGMLLYVANNLAAAGFAAAVAMASKYVFRVALGTGKDGLPVVRHVLNPSNFGITVTLLLFPMVGIAPPYQFTENTSGLVDWLLPLLIIGTGSYLNIKATGRMPLILVWVAAFAVQALVRAVVHNAPVLPGLVPISGFAFILFTFYMITDPATTPAKPLNQVLFGASVAVWYALFMELHIVFGMFYALTITTACRGLWLAFAESRRAWQARPRPVDPSVALPAAE